MSAPVIAPRAPERPRERTVNHVLHFLLSVFTLGLWAPVWIFCGLNVKAMRNSDQRIFEARYEAWKEEYVKWADWYYRTYGVPAPPYVG